MPFTTDQFFAVFEAYNTAIWPAHIGAYAIGIVTLWSIVAERAWSGRAAYYTLAIYWIWNGIAYHYRFFAPVNPAAYGFAALFVIQGLLFLAYASHASAIRPERGFWKGMVPGLLIVYAMAIYPALGYLAGHGWPISPMFGVAPCPTTIFTLAVLMASPRVPFVILAIPVTWALVGTSAAVVLNVPEDLGLLAGVVLVVGQKIRFKMQNT